MNNVYQARSGYFKKCDAAVAKWRKEGPKPLNNGGWDINGKPLEFPSPGGYNSGLYLFTDRNTITHFFKPNFLPPYDTEEKRKIILDFLKDEWDEKSLSWKPVKSDFHESLESKIDESLKSQSTIEVALEKLWKTFYLILTCSNPVFK